MLFLIQHDGESYWVEADIMKEAIVAWQDWLGVQEDPEQIALMDDRQVIR